MRILSSHVFFSNSAAVHPTPWGPPLVFFRASLWLGCPRNLAFCSGGRTRRPKAATGVGLEMVGTCITSSKYYIYILSLFIFILFNIYDICILFFIMHIYIYIHQQKTSLAYSVIHPRNCRWVRSPQLVALQLSGEPASRPTTNYYIWWI